MVKAKRWLQTQTIKRMFLKNCYQIELKNNINTNVLEYENKVCIRFYYQKKILLLIVNGNN